MSIIQIQPVNVGEVGVLPSDIKMTTTDNLGTITTAGYLNAANLMGISIGPANIIYAFYSWNISSNSGTFGVFTVSVSNGIITLALKSETLVGPTVVSTAVTSATPGTIRSLVGSLTQTATVMTSGNIVGVRGVVNMVGASGGFIYGVQGKVVVTGTLSGSEWTAGVFGQLDISAATINAGQIAPIWGDYGTTSGTLTNETGMYGIAMTNTTAAVLAGQLYLYGGATNLMLLQTNAGLSGVTYFITSGTSAGSWGNATPPTPSKVLRISVDGTAYYLPLVAQNT